MQHSLEGGQGWVFGIVSRILGVLFFLQNNLLRRNELLNLRLLLHLDKSLVPHNWVYLQPLRGRKSTYKVTLNRLSVGQNGRLKILVLPMPLQNVSDLVLSLNQRLQIPHDRVLLLFKSSLRRRIHRVEAKSRSQGAIVSKLLGWGLAPWGRLQLTVEGLSLEVAHGLSNCRESDRGAHSVLRS